MLQPALSDAQTPKDTWKFYFNWVFNTFQAHQCLWFPGLCDQHLWTAHNAFYFWCKKCSNGSKLLLLVLHRVHYFLACPPFIPHGSQRGWKEWWVASCGAQLCHTNSWVLGMSVPRCWQPPTPRAEQFHCPSWKIWDLQLALGAAAAPGPALVCANRCALGTGDALWSCEAGTDEGSSVCMILATVFKIIHCSCASEIGQEESY